MNTIYTLENGKKITVFMWDDFFKNDTIRGVADVHTFRADGQHINSKEIHKKLFKDDKGIYIVWDSKKVYLNDFDVLSVDELIAKIQDSVDNNNRWPFASDEIWATILRHFDEIGIIADVPVYDMIVPGLGIGFTSDKTVETLCAPYYNEMYGEDMLSYKIQFKCIIPGMNQLVSKDTMYFSDFCSMLLSGHIKLVNLKTDREMLMEKYDCSNYAFARPFDKEPLLDKLKDKFLKNPKKQKIIIPPVLNV